MVPKCAWMIIFCFPGLCELQNLSKITDQNVTLNSSESNSTDFWKAQGVTLTNQSVVGNNSIAYWASNTTSKNSVVSKPEPEPVSKANKTSLWSQLDWSNWTLSFNFTVPTPDPANAYTNNISWVSHWFQGLNYTTTTLATKSWLGDTNQANSSLTNRTTSTNLADLDANLTDFDANLTDFTLTTPILLPTVDTSAKLPVTSPKPVQAETVRQTGSGLSVSLSFGIWLVGFGAFLLGRTGP